MKKRWGHTNKHTDDTHPGANYSRRRNLFRRRQKFLVACTRLYTSLCRSVGPLVRRSVRRSEITSLFSAFRAERRSDLSYCPCLTTILSLPTRTRLMLLCIRPCSFQPLLCLQLLRSKLHYQFLQNLTLNSKQSNYKYNGCLTLI